VKPEFLLIGKPKPHTDELEARAFVAFDNLTNKPSLDSIWLYDDKRAFFFWMHIVYYL
jgi:hypothetical protein